MSANGSVCQLRAVVGGGPIAGTCWFVSKDRLMTAAHNVYDGAERSKKVTVQIPQGGSLEFGQAQIAILPGYGEAKAKPHVISPYDFDVALLKLPLPYRPAEPLAWQETSRAKLAGQTVKVCGYPDDSPEQLCLSGEAAAATKFLRLIQYAKTTKQGQSGGPVMVGATTVAVHVKGDPGLGSAVVLDAGIGGFIRNG